MGVVQREEKVVVQQVREVMVVQEGVVPVLCLPMALGYVGVVSMLRCREVESGPA